MKKTKNNIFKSLVLAVVALTAGVLVACGGTSLKTEEDIAEQMFAKEEYMLTNVYGVDTERDLNTSGSDYFVANENLFVKVATEVDKDIAQIKLGHVLYNKDQTVEAKVSSVNTLSRKAYMLEEGQLFVSSVLMFLNTSNDGVLRIDFPKNDYMQIMINVYNNDQNNFNLNVKQVNEETLHVVDGANLKYKFTTNNPNSKLFFEVMNGEESLDETTQIVVQTTANPDRQNQSSAIRFENPATISGEFGMGVEVAPGYNQGNEYTETSPADHLLVYNIYVPGMGTKTVLVEFENTFAAE